METPHLFMPLFNLFAQSPETLAVACLIFGMLWGSFFNVVVYRLPIMLERDFRAQSIDYLNQDESFTLKIPDSQKNDSETFNLVLPNSTCPKCKHLIRPYENIPVISYIFLKGKCSACKNPISLRYPTVEMITGLMSAFLALHFGWSLELAAALIFSYALLCLALIDFDTQLLLDSIVFPILWLGLLVNVNGMFTSLQDAVIGAMVGYLALWSVFWIYKLITGKEGMGYGDFKLLALLGAWMGWQYIPLVILLSSLTGTVIGGSYLLLNKQDTSRPISFGPYLASAGWIAFIWGDTIINQYLLLFKI